MFLPLYTWVPAMKKNGGQWVSGYGPISATDRFSTSAVLACLGSAVLACLGYLWYIGGVF
jgi:hypothetical protein